MAASSINIKDFHTLPGKLTDSSTYTFPQIITKPTKADDKRLIYEVIVRLVSRDDNTVFHPIADAYFDSKTKIPDNIIGYIKVNSRYSTNPDPKKSDFTLVPSGKNIGKTNATNVFTQALRDALSIYNKQVKKANGNSEMPATVGMLVDADVTATATATATSTAPTDEPTDVKTQPPPMLAQVYRDLKKPIDFNAPVFIQRKFNGVRAVATKINGQIVFYSRGRKTYPDTNIAHIIAEIATFIDNYPGIHLDGELYVHGVPLQDISGATRGTAKMSFKLQFHIYDCFFPNKPNLLFDERLNILREIFQKFPLKSCVFVETIRVEGRTKEDAERFIDRFYQQWLSEHFEGAMIRLNSPYRYSTNSYHCAELLKMKPLSDGEFKVVDLDQGEKGKAVGAFMFVFETADGKRFTVTPMGKLEWRKKRYEELNATTDGKTLFERKYKGKMMRVHYDELSKDGVPLRARILEEYLRPDDE